ncbi:hypothetical protein BPAE_0004g01180 [Botrytis paeoniae]|uniref:2EXR domain-containing protein n=1 Tax=Botrytis paeoniae TaxID=278948 RepID=A0A4Z1G6J6_9HELO|nr:hypothetical protein BPAE_0004g01180 [Botrytis paeoniae]
MANPSAIIDGVLSNLNSGVEQLAICNLQQETDNSNPCTNEGETTPATDIRQTRIVPENDTSTSSDTISREAPSKFESFPRLAVELRLVIWGLACSQERLLEITTHPTDISFDLGAPTPSVLFVNHESREEAEKHHKKRWIRILGPAHHAVTLVPNLKKYILTLPIPEIPQDILDAFACRKEQKVYIVEMQSALQEDNRKNPACPTPIVEFEISVQAPSSALKSPAPPPDSVSR